MTCFNSLDTPNSIPRLLTNCSFASEPLPSPGLPPGPTATRVSYPTISQRPSAAESLVGVPHPWSPNPCLRPYLTNSNTASPGPVSRIDDTFNTSNALDSLERPPSLISWNIAGLAGKLNDQHWLKIIDDFTIICLQETWLTRTDSAFINGFQAFFQPAIPSAAGRASGGLATFIKLSANFKVVSVLPGCPYYQLSLFRVDKGPYVICINFYNNIPLQLCDSVLGSLEEALDSLVTTDGLDPLIIWCGDFNIHPCLRKSSITCGLFDEHSESLLHFSHSQLGSLLNNLMIRFRLRHANDVSSPPFPFFNTFYSRGSKSIVDYVLVSHHFCSHNFVIECPDFPFSDHFPLILKLCWLTPCTGPVSPTHPLGQIRAHRRNGVRIRSEERR